MAQPAMISFKICTLIFFRLQSLFTQYSHSLQPAVHTVGTARHVDSGIVTLRTADIVGVKVFGKRCRKMHGTGCHLIYLLHAFVQIGGCPVGEERDNGLSAPVSPAMRLATACVLPVAEK